MWMSGTSFSAPIVAGAAAQLLARKPDLTPDQVKGALMASARYLPTADPGAGVGEVDAAAAAAVASPPNPNENLYAFVSNGDVQRRRVGELRLGQRQLDAVELDCSNWVSSNWVSSNWVASNWVASNWVVVELDGVELGRVQLGRVQLGRVDARIEYLQDGRRPLGRRPSFSPEWGSPFGSLRRGMFPLLHRLRFHVRLRTCDGQACGAFSRQRRA